jgi:hypothetical protein
MAAPAPTLDPEASAAIARRIRARVRRCWHNAACAVHHLGDGAHYVEGWVVVNRSDPYVIEHGWCEVGMRVVDPSYTDYVTRGVTSLEPPLAYFAGLRFTPDEAAAGLEHRQLPLAWSEHEDSYDRAFTAAWRVATTGVRDRVPATTRVVNCRREPFDVFISRPSRWSNPFHIGRDGSREEVIARYREWLIRQPILMRDLKSLRGKTLGCDCPPRRCHGEVLTELANEP